MGIALFKDCAKDYKFRFNFKSENPNVGDIFNIEGNYFNGFATVIEYDEIGDLFESDGTLFIQQRQCPEVIEDVQEVVEPEVIEEVQEIFVYEIFDEVQGEDVAGVPEPVNVVVAPTHAVKVPEIVGAGEARSCVEAAVLVHKVVLSVIVTE